MSFTFKLYCDLLYSLLAVVLAENKAYIRPHPKRFFSLFLRLLKFLLLLRLKAELSTQSLLEVHTWL